MRKSAVVLSLVVISIMVFATGSAKADLSEVVGMFEYELTLDYYSHYVWRGQMLNESSFQPGFSVAYGGLTAGFWGQMDLTEETGHQWQFTEVDWSLDYTTTIAEGVDASVGVIYYNFATTTAADTTEVYWGFSFDLPFSPSVTVYHDIDEIEGTYVSLGGSHGWDNVIDLGEIPVGLEVGASVGWGDEDYNTGYWGVSDSGFNDLNVYIALPMEMGDWSVTPSFNWTTVIDSKLRDTNTATTGYDDASEYFYVGISFAKSF